MEIKQYNAHGMDTEAGGTTLVISFPLCSTGYSRRRPGAPLRRINREVTF